MQICDYFKSFSKKQFSRFFPRKIGKNLENSKVYICRVRKIRSYLKSRKINGNLQFLKIYIKYERIFDFQKLISLKIQVSLMII